MVRHHLEQYFTPIEIAQKCVSKVRELLGAQITQYVEPSAGAGAFLPYLPPDTLAYDIDPKHPLVLQQDYLKLELPYLKGRCVIGNPPFGHPANLWKAFLNKASLQGDYVAFILPIGMLNNNVAFWKFELIHSEELDNVIFENCKGKIACCFNIYQRPMIPKVQPSYRLECVEIRLSARSKGAHLIPDPCDYRMCRYGMAGKRSEYPNQFCGEYCFFIKEPFKTRVVELLSTTNYPSIFHIHHRATLSQWRLWKYIKEQIPDIY
jgi:hypothetical protein